MTDGTVKRDNVDEPTVTDAAGPAAGASPTSPALTRRERLLRLARSAPIVLRRHGPVVLGWNALRWLSGQRGYFLRDLLMDVPDFRAIPDPIEEDAEATVERLALCISGVGHGAMRYRCAHLAEQFALGGSHADVVTIEQAHLPEALTRYRVFVLHRVMAAPDTLAFVTEARRRGKVVVFDTDDLVFDVSLLHHMPGVGAWSRVERQYVADTLARNRRMLRACDAVTVSTTYLRDVILTTSLHARVTLIPNVVSAEMLQGADTALASASALADVVAPVDTIGAQQPWVTLGYFSGTRTHDQDFLEAADALLWALERYPRTRLQIVGPLTLDNRFNRFTERVTRLPLQPWQRLPALYAAVDINLAPLERGNPFTEAKSCIKYLEAALCAVPTIASPRSDFRRVIEPGVTGMLADTPAEWRAALAHLIESPDERRAMGQCAAHAVRERETTAARAQATCAVYRGLVPVAFASP